MSGTRLLAAGPWVLANCCVPHRAVLRRIAFATMVAGRKEEGVQFVTHVECAYENGKRGYDSGHYFQSDWRAAAEDFAKRAGKTLRGCLAVVTEEEVIQWIVDRQEKEEANGV